VEALLADLHFPIEEYSAPGLAAPSTLDDTRSFDWTRTFLPCTHNPRMARRKRFLAHERRSIPDLWFRQEYLCEFVELGSVVFRFEDLMAIPSVDVQPFFDAGGAFQDVQPVSVQGRAAFALGGTGHGDVWTP
jgi:hypothetical protein